MKPIAIAKPQSNCVFIEGEIVIIRVLTLEEPLHNINRIILNNYKKVISHRRHSINKILLKKFNYIPNYEDRQIETLVEDLSNNLNNKDLKEKYGF